MKTKTIITLLIAAFVAISAGQSKSALIPAEPVGWLSAYPTIVQTGTKPTLSWSINFPSTVSSYATITPPGLLTTQSQVDVDIRVIGAGVTVGKPSATNTKWVTTQALISLNDTTAKSIFLGTNTDVKPDALVWSQRLNKNVELTFAGRYYFNGAWSQPYSSSNSNNIRILKNGELPPLAHTLSPDSDRIKPFLAPYLDGGGKIKIGPLDSIIMMELTQPESNTNDKGYNLQDMVLLMTVKPKGNNGHGNNIDGVDASNPGNAPFMKYDTNAAIDDEKK